ncbi:uncharacterized protein LOC123683217 [Harmonia axyridis]|uniref:uncharacterized protein LOC123683217 n=1 Tax=Harmonia axyridis TaxID=115357 RepID=UPI001E277E26|nr:uncharacterized protein LOC123683217 [Harmonia axyridis]
MCGGKQSMSISLFFFMGALVIATSVKINKLQVPEVIKYGAPVVLDCDFTLEETDQDLVVKWYFNRNNRSLVYQWIPASQNRPQVLGVLKDHLNMEYATGLDAYSKQRALHILDAGPDLSGDYTCSVSTMQSEDIRTKSMLVFVPERSLMVRRMSAGQGKIRVQCLAEGVYPNPIVMLYSLERDIGPAAVTSRQRGELYDVSATATLDELQEPEEFACDLTIPQANYSVRRETVIYPGNNGTHLGNAKWIIVAAFTWLFLYRTSS